MKKIIFTLLFTILFGAAYAQKGDLYFGAKGGYATDFEGILYGFDIAYQLADPLEVNLSGLMNTGIESDDELNKSEKRRVGIYSASLDFRYFLLLQRTWATGPSLGGQYLFLKKEEMRNNFKYDESAAGFNIGWHFRANLTENIRMNGGWRYTSASKDANHHLIYLGIGYNFSLF